MTLMKSAHANVLDAIGNTPIVKLNKVSAEVDADIYVKLEFMNPGGSIKDRIGVHMIDVAEREGLLKPGGTIIEATSGNTGMGLALTAAVRGYKCIFVMADKQSEEKRTALRAVGAKVVVCPTNVEPEDPRSYYSVADKLAAETPNSFYTSQYHNQANPESHYLSTGPEIWEQCGDEMDALVVSIGTGGTVSGISKYLKERRPEIEIVGVDPVGSIYYDLFHTGQMPAAHSYYVEGIGEDFMPSTMNMKAMDDIVQVSDRECFNMARRLLREEGLLIGGSSGGAVEGAIKYARSAGRKADGSRRQILVILPDSSSRYLSKFLNDEWLRDAGFLEAEPLDGTVADLLKPDADGVFTAGPEAPLGEVIDRMKTHGISQLPVCADGKLQGMVTEVQVLDALVRGQATMVSPVGPLCSLDGVATVNKHTTLSTLTAHFSEGKIAIVLDDDKQVAGVVTKIDLIEHMAS